MASSNVSGALYPSNALLEIGESYSSYQFTGYLDEIHIRWTETTSDDNSSAPGPTPVGGTISTDTTWSIEGSPYIVTSNISILGTDGSDGITTLTIEPGVTVKFETDKSLTVGAASGDPGALVAQGTAVNPVTFTSNQANPAAGDWHGIKILNTSDDATTRLEHCVVAYPGKYGNSVTAAIVIVDAAPTLANCRFIHGYYYDLMYSGTVGGTVSGCTLNSGISLLATSSVDFTGNTFNHNAAHPTRANADDVHSLINGNTFENLDADSYLEINSGSLTKDSTWTAAIPIYVRYDLTVQGTDGPDGITTLTIEPGATLRFGTAKGIYVGAASGDPGALVAQGTAASPITFTSNQATPAAGDWYGIKIRNTSVVATTCLENCVVEYSGKAGYDVAGAVQIRDAAPTIINCTFNNNYYGAVRSQDANPTLTNCTFNNSNYYDLYYYGTVGETVSGCTLNSGIYLPSASTVNFTGNTFNHNSAYPSRVNADDVHGLVNNNTFTNLDANSCLEINSSSLTRDSTWTAAITLNIRQDLTIQGVDGDDAITTLTIEPGVTVKFETGRSLKVGAASGDPGALVAQGTAANPITFTSNEETPAAGDWHGIRFYNTADDATTVMEHCAVKYGGYTYGSLYACQSSPTFRNITVQNSKTYGAYIHAAAAPIIENCTFSGNQDYDLYYNNAWGGSVTGTTINNGIFQSYTGPMHFSGNTINQNNAFPIKVNADNIGGISNSTFNNVDEASYLQLYYGDVTRDATWSSSIPIYIPGDMTVNGGDGADGITSLTIAPGAKLKFDSNKYLDIGATGALIAQGTAENRIIFTSNNVYPTAGIWGGLRFYNTAADNPSIVSYSVVEYAGCSGHGAVYLNNAKPVLSHNVFKYSSSAGVYLTGSASSNTEILCNTFVHNNHGVHTGYNALPLIHENNFNGNSGYAVNNGTTAVVNAENNWWGDAQGPNTSGDRTYGQVDAEPWSIAENTWITSGENHPPNIPETPDPRDNAVRVALSSGAISLRWTGGDPDPQDTTTYDLQWGDTGDTLAPAAQNIDGNEYQMTGLLQGVTYYWQIISRDNHGMQSAGPVWRFTTQGDPPDLIVAGVSTVPAGHLQAGQSVTFTATIQNLGSGPAVDPFTVDMLIDGVSLGPVAVGAILHGGESVLVSWTWTYAGGDPGLQINADNQSQVSETDEQNNSLVKQLSEAADMTAPALTGTSPAGGTYLQQVDSISATLADARSQVDDAAVITNFTVIHNGQQTVSGTVSESNDTFAFAPATVPLADGAYTINLVAADIYGNTQNYSFVFTVDSQPPAKPVITGGSVSSGTIEPRPAQNTADQFIIELTGTREADTAVLINGVERAWLGDAPWSVQVNLQPGANALEARLRDRAGNLGEAEWVDINLATANTIQLDYDASGRVKHIGVAP